MAESHRAQNVNNDAYVHPPPRYDIPEVSVYLASGLVVSAIDKWFMGPVPRFPLTPGFGIPPTNPGSGVTGISMASTGVGTAADGFEQDVPMEGADAPTGGKTRRLDEALKKARSKLQEGRQGLHWPPVNTFYLFLAA